MYESVSRWFRYIKGMRNDRNAKRLYVGEYIGCRTEGRPRKRWINSRNDCLKKRDFNVGQSRKMEYEYQGFMRGNA